MASIFSSHGWKRSFISHAHKTQPRTTRNDASPGGHRSTDAWNAAPATKKPAPAQTEDDPFGDPPSFDDPAASPEDAAYNAALALWATDKNNWKIQFGSLPKSELEYIATTSKVTERVEAALLILEKKFDMPRPSAA